MLNKQINNINKNINKYINKLKKMFPFSSLKMDKKDVLVD